MPTSLTRGIWRTRDGRQYHIEDMSTNHLWRTVFMIWRSCDNRLPTAITYRRLFVGMLEELDKRRADIPLMQLHQLSEIASRIERVVQTRFSDYPSAVAAIGRKFTDTFNQRRVAAPVTRRGDLPAMRSTVRVPESRSINLDDAPESLTTRTSVRDTRIIILDETDAD